MRIFSYFWEFRCLLPSFIAWEYLLLLLRSNIHMRIRKCDNVFFNFANQDQDLPGQSLCPPCGTGTYTEAPASTKCTPCPLGKSQGTTGATSCNDCLPGTLLDVFFLGKYNIFFSLGPSLLYSITPLSLFPLCRLFFRNLRCQRFLDSVFRLSWRPTFRSWVVGMPAL